MSVKKQFVDSSLKAVTRIICRVDDSQLWKIPQHGPLILVSNHINFLEVPLLYTHLQPRPVTGFAKAETWDDPFLRPLFNLWGGIPLKRGEPDIYALRQAREVIDGGGILAVAPEGTRSGTGCLQKGYPGVVIIALHSGAPLMPMVYFGSENFRQNITRLRRTEFCIRVGQPFYLDPAGEKVTRQTRQKMTDEIMYQLSALLPSALRGYYADLSSATEDYLRFEPPAHSNLPVHAKNQLLL